MAEKVIHDVTDDVRGETKESSLLVDELTASNQFIVEDVDSSSVNIEVESWKTSDEFMKYIESSLETFPKIEGSKYAMIHAVAYGEKLRDQMFDVVASCDNEFKIEQLQRLDEIDSIVLNRLDEIQALLELNSNLAIGENHFSQTKRASGKSARWTLVVDPFIAAIVRLCINAKVQGGKDIEDIYKELEKKYNLDDREKLQILYILIDSGYPVRGSLMDGQDMISQYLG